MPVEVPPAPELGSEVPPAAAAGSPEPEELHAEDPKLKIPSFENWILKAGN